MNKYGSMVAFLLLFLSQGAAAGWYKDFTVKNVRNQGNLARITFATQEPVVNPAGCPNADHYGIDSANDPKGSMSILLSALMSGAPVSIYVLDSDCDLNGRPSVTNVLIGEF